MLFTTTKLPIIFDCTQSQTKYMMIVMTNLRDKVIWPSGKHQIYTESDPQKHRLSIFAYLLLRQTKQTKLTLTVFKVICKKATSLHFIPFWVEGASDIMFGLTQLSSGNHSLFLDLIFHTFKGKWVAVLRNCKVFWKLYDMKNVLAF